MRLTDVLLPLDHRLDLREASQRAADVLTDEFGETDVPLATPNRRQREAREMIEYQKGADARNRRPADREMWLVRVRNVQEALDARDIDCLRGSLVDLAACCERWAEGLRIRP